MKLTFVLLLLSVLFSFISESEQHFGFTLYFTGRCYKTPAFVVCGYSSTAQTTVIKSVISPDGHEITQSISNGTSSSANVFINLTTPASGETSGLISFGSPNSNNFLRFVGQFVSASPNGANSQSDTFAGYLSSDPNGYWKNAAGSIAYAGTSNLLNGETEGIATCIISLL